MLIRREVPTDVPAVRAVTAGAFANPDTPVPVEVSLFDELRTCPGWLPPLSLTAIGSQEEVIGHVVCTRGYVDASPVLGLGPLSVHPLHQYRGVGLALVHTVLGAADALGEPLVALLGNPRYYARFGFRASIDYNIAPPEPRWDENFQVRALSTYESTLRGAFTYAEPFNHL